MLPIAGISLLLTVLCCVHAVRAGQDTRWIYLIVFLQPLGPVIYILAILLPDLASGRQGRQLGRAALNALDPTRAYREAQTAVEDAPTVHNQMRLAEAAAGLGHYEEAAEIYGRCAVGVHADDPTLLQRHAQCLLELKHAPEALAVLEKLGNLGEPGRTPQAALLLARAHDNLGDAASAETAYIWAAERASGLEALARYVGFLIVQGRTSEAEIQMATLEKRLSKVPRAFRREAAIWHDFARDALRMQKSGG